MSRTKGSKNRPKTNTNYSTQITEKQESMEDMRNEAAREAEKMKAIRMARLMIEDGKLNYEDIAMYTELTLEEVEKIALEKKSA